jgi:hypothetical protein
MADTATETFTDDVAVEQRDRAPGLQQFDEQCIGDRRFSGSRKAG